MGLELVIESLSKTYPGGVRALRDVSLRIPTGMFGLLGPNGAGKSTLMRTIATLQEADSGSVKLDGLDVLRQKDEVRKILGYLPQEFGVYPRVTAEEMLSHLAVLKGIVDTRQRREVVQRLLRQTNLWDAKSRKLGTFSGGMKQRFGIAQALLGDPRLIIVDEPTAGLDPAERNRFLNLLAEVGENIIVILSTHIVADVTDLCSRMAVLSRGEVTLTGSPAEAMASLRGRVWRTTIARAQLAELQQSHDVLSTQLVAGRTLVHVLAESRPEGDFEPVDPDLEDVYFCALGADRVAA
jgi:ABC-type multidrug transport system ATPase subunit